jgi:non-heme chloroperoxidase
MPRFQTADHTDLFYREWGDGDPVLFVSSAAVSSDWWQYQMLHLAEHGFRCVAYDRRGHGRSDDPGHGYDYDTLAGDLAALVEHLDLNDVTLVGHSMGGAEIVRYLTRHGADRVARIALVSATLPFLLQTDDNPDGFPLVAVEQVRAGWTRDYARWMDENAAAFFGEGLPGCEVSSGLREWAIRDMSRTSLQAVFECNRAVVGTDFRPELAEVAVPTLVIHGDHDVSAPFELTGARTAQLVPGAELTVYTDAAHGLLFTHTDRLNDDLRGFAKR